jgi:hypothetical protein
LETLPAVTESPRLAPAAVTENDTFCTRPVPPVQAEAFRGFLDGAQTSRVVMYDQGVPIIHGVAAAVIRERRDRRLVTWRGVRKHEAVYAPMTLVPDVCQRLSDDGVEVVDTSARLAESDSGIPLEGAHPAVLVDRARRCVEARREQLEQALALEWCEAETAPIYIDGSIAGRERVAAAPQTIGVVHRHDVLYGGTEALPLLSALREGERTTVFEVRSRRSWPVWSWYLRLRYGAGLDPLWGLVRIESAPIEGAGTIGDRADAVSNSVLAERVPVALPD